MVLINVKIEGVVRVGWIMRMALLCLDPGDDFTHILDDGLALGNILRGKHPFTMHAGAPGLNAATETWSGFLGHF